MSPTAFFRKPGTVNLHGRGPAASTLYTLPDTSVHVRWMAAPVMGLVPTSPTMEDGDTSVIPLLLRIANPPADPRATGDRTFPPLVGFAARLSPVLLGAAELGAVTLGAVSQAVRQNA